MNNREDEITEVYVNDFSDGNDFLDVVSTLFPKVDLPVDTNNFELSYYSYDSWLGEKTLEIDSSRNFKYYNENRMRGSEKYEGKLPKDKMVKVILNVQNSDFFEVDIHETCAHPSRLLIRYGGRRRAILFCIGNKMNELASDILSIVKSCKR